MPDISRDPLDFDVVFDVIVVGAGACGLSAGMAARDQGAEVLIVERDETPIGSTGMSTGLIPAAGHAPASRLIAAFERTALWNVIV